MLRCSLHAGNVGGRADPRNMTRPRQTDQLPIILRGTRRFMPSGWMRFPPPPPPGVYGSSQLINPMFPLQCQPHNLGSGGIHFPQEPAQGHLLMGEGHGRCSVREVGMLSRLSCKTHPHLLHCRHQLFTNTLYRVALLYFMIISARPDVFT